ncbi:MAG: ATP-dependent zinc metalloprotease FtsH [Christensenellales bacterium]
MLGGTKPKELTYEGDESLMQLLKENKVAAIYINGGYTAYILAEGSTTTKDAFYKNPTKQATYFVRIPSRTEFASKLDELTAQEGINVPVVKYDDPNSGSTWTSLLFPIGSLLLMGIVVFFLFKQAGGANKQAMNFGKTKARLNTNVNVKFSDVAGAEEEKVELAEIVEFLKNPQKFTALGARIPKGVLLVGPPGTGKTLFAKAVAGESNVPFFSISGSDFVEMFVGTGAARVRDLFDQAKRNMPCIIFIDEIDAVGRHRGAGLGGGNDEREQTLNQLLVQMDGFEKNDGIIIMAATNRVDILDPALMRPGRFDRQIYVNTPDVKGREAIFKVHARNKPLASEISFKVLARMTSGFSGADIENLLNEASILAARADRKVIVMEDILEAINKVIAGPQKKSRIITDSDKRITAYHEAGHAIIAKVLPHCDEVQEVSIIPRGMAAGYTLTRPESDDSHISKNKLTDMITMMLGGRAAEEIVIHDVSTGASNDIQRATSIARSMVTEWGMSDKVGNIFLGGEKEVFLGKDYATQHSYSEKIGDLIDSEIKKIIDECYKRAIELLKEKRDILDNMVKVLFEKETIYTSEVEMLFEGKSAEEVIDSIDKRQEKNDRYKKESPSKVEIVPEKKQSEPVKLEKPQEQNNAQSGDDKGENGKE